MKKSWNWLGEFYKHIHRLASEGKIEKSLKCRISSISVVKT